MPIRAALCLLLALLACLIAPAPGATGAEGWQWPVRGPVLTPFRNGADPYAAGQHRGIDIGAPAGSPVLAATGGRVRFAGVAGSSGLTVSVRTADGRYDTSYLHLSAATVRKGDSVRAGQRVGAVGTTGKRSVSAPHLHFGVREAGSRHVYLDPLGLLPPPPGPARQAPRPGAVPVRAPVRAVPSPERVRAPRRFPRPEGVRVRRPLRVPAVRGVRVPSVAPPPLAALPSRVRAPAPARVRSRPAHHRAPGRAPETGPEAAPDVAPSQLSPAPRNAPARAARERSTGPDLGWALACAGLLLAAACLGRPGTPGRQGGRARSRLPWLARLHLR
jgi:Peptidase family M23